MRASAPKVLIAAETKTFVSTTTRGTFIYTDDLLAFCFLGVPYGRDFCVYLSHRKFVRAFRFRVLPDRLKRVPKCFGLRFGPLCGHGNRRVVILRHGHPS